MGHAHSQELFASYLRYLRVWTVTVLVILLSACSPATVEVVTSPDFHGAGISPTAILPFQLDALDYSTRKFHYSNSVVPPTAPAIVTDLFYAHLNKKVLLSLVPPYRVNTAVNDFILPPLNKDLSYAIAREIGTRLKAKTVLIGSVSQYRERIGNAIGISRSASVGFEARLINVRDGNVLWTGHFFETQRPMISDLQGFLQRRRWLTAKELAEDGVKKILDQGWE